MKKIIYIIACYMFVFSLNVSANEEWESLFVTRLMKLMTANPSYTDIVITDIDKNSVPEAFLLKKGAGGEIHTGITYRDGSLVNIQVPTNVTGACLEDITVYDVNGSNVYVGKEISKDFSEILYFELKLENDCLICSQVNKSDYSDYYAHPYKDIFDNDFYENDFPDRDKINSVFSKYSTPNHINLKPASAKVTVNGNLVDLAGIMVSDNNYYKIRDVAMVLSTGVNRFSVNWDSEKSAISITTGRKYSPVGGELSGNDDLIDAKVSFEQVTLIVNGESFTFEAYNINDNNYFKIRDLAYVVGFDVGWDAFTGTVTIQNN